MRRIEQSNGNIGEGEFQLLRAVVNWNTGVFSKHKGVFGSRNFVEHEIKLEKGAVPQRKGARRMTQRRRAEPHESEACRAEI